jgi:hypothetical protein
MADLATTIPPGGGDEPSTAQHVKEQATAVGQSAVQAGGDVVESAKDQAAHVASETSAQVRDLYGEARTQLAQQAGVQQERAVAGLRSLGDEVRAMADRGGESGPATQMARHASDTVHRAAQWLDEREPGHVLDDVKSYARNNPGTFLLGAAVLGVLAGRLTRNLAADPKPRADIARGSAADGRHKDTGIPGSEAAVYPPIATVPAGASAGVAASVAADPGGGLPAGYAPNDEVVR